MLVQQVLKIATPGRGLINITDKIKPLVSQAAIVTGLCHIFLHHTSASLIINENADPTVLNDFEAFMQRLLPDGDPLFKHVAEGPDDMPSHVRTILTQTFLCVPITQNQLTLGTWQGLFLWEHRLQPHEREITMTILGNSNVAAAATFSPLM